MSYIAKYRTLYILFFAAAAATVGMAVAYDMWYWFLATVLWTKFIALFGTSIGLHRYFSHSGFKTGPIRHKLFLFLSILNGQGSPVSWSTLHIYHHAHSDTPDDIHGPGPGFMHSVLTWGLFMNKRMNKYVYPFPKHLIKQRDTMWVHHNYFAIWWVMIIAMALVSWQACLFLLLAPAGFSILHSNIGSNYLEHVQGFPGSYKNYDDVGDHSYNNKWIQLFLWGEGLHNNHHKYMNDYSQAKKPGEYDPAAWLVEKLFKTN